MLTHSLQEPAHHLHKTCAPWGPLSPGLASHLLLLGALRGSAAGLLRVDGTTQWLHGKEGSVRDPSSGRMAPHLRSLWAVLWGNVGFHPSVRQGGGSEGLRR